MIASLLDVLPWVYAIESDSDGKPVKVGTAENPLLRLAQLQSASPHELRLLGGIEGDKRTEGAVHTRLKESRIRGEWFRRTDDVEQFLSELLPVEVIERAVAAKKPVLERKAMPRLRRVGQSVAVIESRTDMVYIECATAAIAQEWQSKIRKHTIGGAIALCGLTEGIHRGYKATYDAEPMAKRVIRGWQFGANNRTKP